MDRPLRGFPVCLAFGAGLWFATSASAAALSVFVGGEPTGYYDATALGCSSGDVVVPCSGGGLTAGDVRLDSWNLTFDNDPVVTGTTGVTNLFATTQRITLIFTLPIAPIPVATLTGGSFSGTLTDNNGDGATISAPAGGALYTALIDGANWQSLYPDPSSISAGSSATSNIASLSFGSPVPSLPGPPALATIGIRLDFNLTGLDSASLTSDHVVVPIPEPSTATLLGLGLGGLGLLGRRRGLV